MSVCPRGAAPDQGGWGGAGVKPLSPSVCFPSENFKHGRTHGQTHSRRWVAGGDRCHCHHSSAAKADTSESAIPAWAHTRTRSPEEQVSTRPPFPDPPPPRLPEGQQPTPALRLKGNRATLTSDTLFSTPSSSRARGPATRGGRASLQVCCRRGSLCSQLGRPWPPPEEEKR